MMAFVSLVKVCFASIFSHRREKNSRKQFAGILGSFFLLAIMTLSFALNSKEDISSQNIKYYTSVHIAQGDTITKYFKSYGKGYNDSDRFISEVMHLNHLRDDGIVEGGYLIIPYYDAITEM